jgi:cell fate regulator YaaT (PSP1 superfamily)
MVMAVTFTRHGKLFYLDPGGHTPRVGQKVLVPTGDGPEVAECVWAPQWVSDDIGGLPVMAGFADDAAIERDERNRKRKTEATITARRIIRKSGLPMKVAAVDVIDTRPDVDHLVLIYFSAPHRVDFRELVRELARSLHSRIELRQVSARDEARVQGGIGSCGRDLCCATFLTDFEPVSLRMAKDQDLPLNPLRISGACGKLMCCLKYEHPLYQDFKASAPPVGAKVSTEAGDGVVVAHSVPADKVVVRMQADGRRVPCPKASVCGSRHAYEAMVADGGREHAEADEPGPPAPAATGEEMGDGGARRRRRTRRRPDRS